MREDCTQSHAGTSGCTGHPSDRPEARPRLQRSGIRRAEPQNPTKTECNNHARGRDAAREVSRQVFCFEFQAIQPHRVFRASQGNVASQRPAWTAERAGGQPELRGKLEASLDCRLSVKSAWVT